MRAGNLAGVDGVAEIHIDEAAGAHVADTGEAGHEGRARVHHAVDRVLCVGLGQLKIGIEVRIHGEVGVHVDHPRHGVHLAKIDDGVSGFGGSRAGRPDRLDGVADNDDSLAVGELAGAHIEKMADTNQGAFL